MLSLAHRHKIIHLNVPTVGRSFASKLFALPVRDLNPKVPAKKNGNRAHNFVAFRKLWQIHVEMLRLIFAAVFVITFVVCDPVTLRRNNILLRKKRYLAFPEGSNFVVSKAAVILTYCIDVLDVRTYWCIN